MLLQVGLLIGLLVLTNRVWANLSAVLEAMFSGDHWLTFWQVILLLLVSFAAVSVFVALVVSVDIGRLP